MTEETLGRRIAAHRKKLGLTQDALAEQLGVTAQAVSKWENNQSCPDIAMLPKLADIFDITIDALLGVAPKEPEPEDAPAPEELPADTPAPQSRAVKRAGIGLALWLLLTGLILTVVELFPYTLSGISLWVAAGLSGLTVFGLMGLYPRFGLFRLCCGLAGGACLYCDVFRPDLQFHTLNVLPRLLPFLLMIFGAGLLLDSFRGRKAVTGHLFTGTSRDNFFEYRGNTFRCGTVFGETQRNITLPQLDGGEASVCFGELTVDLYDCGSFHTECGIFLKCVFGSLTLCVPRGIRLDCTHRNVFGEVREIGRPDPDAQTVIRVQNEVCFGSITLKYI